MIFSIIFIIALISLGLSLLSLRHELKKTKHEEKVTEDLAKGKVLFYSPSSDTSSGKAS